MSFLHYASRDEDFVSTIHKRCVTINMNGDISNGKLLHLESEWTQHDFLNAASNRLGVSSLSRIFSADGVEIDDCIMIEDKDILFLSNGDDFIAPSMAEKSTLECGGIEPINGMISGYRVRNLLGRGGFGEVRVGEHHLTGERVALKFLRKAEIISMGAAERTTTEIQCLSALRHQNIIRLQQQLESPQHVVLVLELMEGGDLFNYLFERQAPLASDGGGQSAFQYALPEDEARHVFGQVLSAVGYAHNQHICHRDLKLENILLKTKSLACVKIADFGLSAFYRPGALMKSTCGTLSFLAPEVFAGTSNAGPPLDVWAMGVILFALLCGRLPFEGPDLRGTKRPRDAVIRSRISKGHYKIEESLSPEAKDLVRRLLRVDPAIRSSVPEIFSHVWMRLSSNVSFDSSRSSLNQGEEQKKSANPRVDSMVVDADNMTLNDGIKNGDDVTIGVKKSNYSAKADDKESDDVSSATSNLELTSDEEARPDNMVRVSPPSPTFDEDVALSPSRGIPLLKSDSRDIEDLIPLPPLSPSRTGRFSMQNSRENSMGSHSKLGSKDNDDNSDKEEYSNSSPRTPPAPSSFVLVPLRRNPADQTKSSPRRPRSSTISSDLEIARYQSSNDCFDYDSNDEGNVGDSKKTISSSPSNGSLPRISGKAFDEDSSNAMKKQAHRNSGKYKQSWTEQLEDDEAAKDKGNDQHDEIFHCDSASSADASIGKPSYSSPTSRNKLHLAGTLSLNTHRIGSPSGANRSRFASTPSAKSEKRYSAPNFRDHNRASSPVVSRERARDSKPSRLNTNVNSDSGKHSATVFNASMVGGSARASTSYGRKAIKNNQT